MKPHDSYLKFVKWSDDDNLYIGYCPDLFPWGGVCHGEIEEDVYGELKQIVEEEVRSLEKSDTELPTPATRPMKEAIVT